MSRLVSTLAFTVMTTIFSWVPVLADCPSADLNSDCVVDLADLAVFGSQWLDVPGGSADLDGIAGVSLEDFAILAAQWRTRGQRVTLVINEFMADNKGFLFDAFGDDDDWIEIYNYGTEPIDIGGMFLTDELADLSPHRIPAGVPEQTTIPGGGYLVLWADGEPGEGALHLGFKLAAGGGEDIALFDSAGRLVDCVSDFGSQAENTSWGRMPDAGDEWRAF
ncbi:MAG: lamin tail domain-containing protein, partial [Phycisphaerae bacterium]|nr:lamin tail domain-containing protein [Phycisphaerae bacterium]